MQPTTSFGSFLVAALTASLATASAIPSAQPGSFSVSQVANPSFSGRNGPLALLKALNKFNIDPPASLIDAAATRASALVKRTSGSGVATPDDGDVEYTVPVKIGTPAQTLNLDFDTGSSDLWVFSSSTAGSTRGHNIYRPSSSSSSSLLRGASWSISYGDGSSSSGTVYTDAVTVGSLTVKKQAVEAAARVSPEFLAGANDGLLGLAFSAINTVKPSPQKTWFDNLTPSLDAPLFVADLRHNVPGSYSFGAVPAAAAAGNLSYVPVDSSQGFWQFTTSTTVARRSFDAIADTGTTLILLDDATVAAYYRLVRGARDDSSLGGYVFDCAASLPDFTFSVGRGSITVPGSLINYAQAQGSTCFGGIQSASGLPFAILGDVALKAAYVVFDGGNTRLGWAQK